MMIDLTQAASTANGALHKAAFKRSGEAGGGLLFELVLAFAVTDRTDAEVADRMVRGALGQWEQTHDTEERGKYYRTPIGIGGDIELTDAETQFVIAAGRVAVRKIEAVKGVKASHLLVHAVLKDQKAVVAANLAEHLGRPLSVRWSSVQPALPFPVPRSVLAVQVVTAEDGAGGYVWGAQTGVDGDRAILDDFGAVRDVALTSIVSRLVLSPGSGAPEGIGLREIVAPIAQDVVEAGGRLSWKHVVLAVAAARGDDMLDEGSYEVDGSMLSSARQLAMTEAVV